jgi:hypothetical protein
MVARPLAKDALPMVDVPSRKVTTPVAAEGATSMVKVTAAPREAVVVEAERLRLVADLLPPEPMVMVTVLLVPASTLLSPP